MKRLIILLLIIGAFVGGIAGGHFIFPVKTAPKTVESPKLIQDNTETQDLKGEIKSLKSEMQDLQGKYNQDEALLRGETITVNGLRFRLKDNTMLYPPYQN